MFTVKYIKGMWITTQVVCGHLFESSADSLNLSLLGLKTAISEYKLELEAELG